MNANWARWTYASVADYLMAVANANSLPAIIDGAEDRSDAFSQAPAHVEIRITGPGVQELSNGYFRLTVDANVLLQCRYELNNAYHRQTLIGAFMQAMAGPIPVFKYGSEPGDDKTWIGCLSVPRANSVKVHHFGQLTMPEKFSESMSDARYTMDIEE